MTSLNTIKRKMAAKHHLPSAQERRAIRVRAGLVQEDLAQLLGVSRETVSRWEAGVRTPRGIALVNYVNLLEKINKATRELTGGAGG